MKKKKIVGSFQNSNENDNIKAPKKTYLEGSSDVKYKEEVDVNIEKRVFQSNKNETNFVDIDSNQDLFLKNMSNKNMDGEIVYSTPKEEREKKEVYKKRTFDNNNENKRERRQFEEKEEKPVTQYDSDGFEIITEKVKTKKTKKREFDGEKKFRKNDDREEKERPQTTRKMSNASDKMNQKPKPVVIEKVQMETTSATNLKDLLK